MHHSKPVFFYFAPGYKNKLCRGIIALCTGIIAGWSSSMASDEQHARVAFGKHDAANLRCKIPQIASGFPTIQSVLNRLVVLSLK